MFAERKFMSAGPLLPFASLQLLLLLLTSSSSFAGDQLAATNSSNGAHLRSAAPPEQRHRDHHRLALAAAAHSTNESTIGPLHIQVAAIHVEGSEFPLSKLLFKLTLRLALEAAAQQLEQRGQGRPGVRVKLSVSIRSANTCSRQYAGAVAAEEYYTKRARLFIVSGCDDAIRAVSRLASAWRVPVMTAAGFGADLNDKSVHRTLVRVAFSLRAAVEFLFKIMRSFQWRRFNLIVDESDANSLALKGSIEKHLLEYRANSSDGFRLALNTIPLDLQSLIRQQFVVGDPDANATHLNGSLATNQESRQGNDGNGDDDDDDRWPNELAERSVRDALRQSSLFSRVNILLIPQHYLRRFMLSVHAENMANGLYTFINMPLLLAESEDQLEAGNSSARVTSYTSTSSNENVFIWRSLKSTKNSQVKLAFESLMSIYLRTPTSKAYIYFASKLTNMANSDLAATTTTASASRPQVSQVRPSRFLLSINPYSASFYDCLQIYSLALGESLDLVNSLSAASSSDGELHAKISELVRGRRYDNLVTGTVLINSNGDRETDYTLDDMNHMTGKFGPVMLFRGETRDIERIGRIHWSSDLSVGPTLDNVDCNLIGTCASKPLPRFLILLMLMTGPLTVVLGLLLCFVHNRLSLESQLVDYWWKIHLSELEIVPTRRKNAADGSLVLAGAISVDSVASSPAQFYSKPIAGRRPRADSSISGHVAGATSGVGGDQTTITRATETATMISSAADVCYGNITLGIYKLSKVALKPISRFHQSRKLMIELRSIKGINHSNLCRFVGILVDEGSHALVSEFCPKGSLREFFHNESMTIDWTFKYSIINDILAGLLYLHSSPLGFHGRLKSSNCLVSARFVVKLSDYGPHTLYEQMDDGEADRDERFRKCIWLAPEHMKSSAKVGSTKGDVYSFGLLLYEIITNKLPFYDLDRNDFSMPLKSLYNELKNNGPTEKTGPNLEAIQVDEVNIQPLVDLMKSCIRFEASKRPSSMVVGTAIKRITKGVTSKKLLENLTTRMEQYTNNLESLVDAKLATLVEEKLKTEELLYQFVPKSIASILKQGLTVEPEAFECVTVFYSDIVGFTSLSSESSPLEVVDFLGDLYLCFDETLEQYDIFKVDTIGDAYIVASGLPQRNGDKHAVEIACAALELRKRLTQFKIPHKLDRSLEMRVGIHSGTCVAGIVGGLNMPKYCVFGETLTIGKFMESSGVPMKIHITEESKNLLEGVAGFTIEPRTPKISKDGLPFQTYWLEKENGY